MQYKKTLVSAALATTAMAAYVPTEPWNTLTPSATYKSGITDYVSTFGIAVVPMSSTSASVAATATASVAKRAAISQIGDGQIQAATFTSSTTLAKKTAAAVSQIGDGQIQATAKTTTAKSTATAVSQIGDGQIQASSATRSTSTLSPASSTSAASSGVLEINQVSCSSSGTLAMTLKKGILTDSKGRIGSIVANRQFQFDGPPPQAGAIYAAGWSITPAGNLAIGDNDVFYQCLSGNFYNLYDESLGAQCSQSTYKPLTWFPVNRFNLILLLIILELHHCGTMHCNAGRIHSFKVFLNLFILYSLYYLEN